LQHGRLHSHIPEPPADETEDYRPAGTYQRSKCAGDQLALEYLLRGDVGGCVVRPAIRADFGVLRYVLVTPQSHRVHHSADPRHWDKNFAVVLRFWDRLAETQWHDHTEYPDTGIDDRAFPIEGSTTPVGVMKDYVGQLVYPFRAIWNARRDRGWEIDGPTPAASAPIVRPLPPLDST
jgi:hypothetical protein